MTVTILRPWAPLPRRSVGILNVLSVACLCLGGLTVAGCSGTASGPSPDTHTAGSSSSATRTESSGSASPASTTTPSVGRLSVSEMVSGLTSPWGLVPLPDGSTLVSERDTAKIKRVVGSQATVVTTIAEAKPTGEGGLLGLALSPGGTTVFAYYTASDDNRIVSMSWDGSRLGEPRLLLTGIPRGNRHDGGRLVVGPDGYLYVGTGDAGNESNSQNKKSLAGKILRLQLDGQPAPGNPFDNEVFSFGHRNVQGLAFDDQGRLWASEFGDQTWDELNLITKGANYGWPEAEGSDTIDRFTNPKVVWKTAEASPSGLAYWQGELWMAALRGKRLWEIPLNGTVAGDPRAHFVNTYGRLRSVMVSNDGSRLLLSASNTDGRNDVKAGDDRLLAITR